MIEKPLYNRGDMYDIQNAEERNDIDFFVKYAKKLKGPVLELACGTGILTIPIANTGIVIDGIDLSSSMLAYARTKAIHTPTISFYKKNMTNFSLGKKYKMIFIGFNSISHLLDIRQMNAMLKCVTQHLEDNGRFIIDCFIPNPKFFMRDPNKRYPVFNDKGLRIVESNTYDPLEQINHIEWYYEYKEEEWKEKLDMKLYYPQELQSILKMNRFKISKSYGNHDFSDLTKESSFQIYECKVN